MPALHRAFIAAVLGWTAALPLAAFFAGHAGSGSPLLGLAVLVYGAGSLVCHQRPERSFLLWGAQFPVCARCAGIYAGAAAAAVVVSLPGVRASALTEPIGRARGILIGASAPTAATLVYEWTTGVTPSNAIRAAAGLPLGLAVAALAAGALCVRRESPQGAAMQPARR
jgi:uncharacterized membrane protein